MATEVGNGLNWTELLERHGSALLLYARQFTGSMTDAEDVLQDGFLKTWRFWKGGANDDPVPYLFRAVKHSAIDHIRRRNRKAKHEELSEDRDYAPQEPVSMFDSPLEKEERRRLIERSLTGLPAEQKEVLLLKIWGDMTFDQISKSLGESPNTVASRYRYGLATLRKELDKDSVL